MLDILAFLFEQYLTFDSCPDNNTLAKRLVIAGFDDDQIDEAISWLNEVKKIDFQPYIDLDKAVGAQPALSFRLLHPNEIARLTPEAQVMFHYLSHSGALSPGQRELLIDQLVQLPYHRVDEDAVKRIVLMLLWRQGSDLANLLIKTLLLDSDNIPIH